MEFFCFYGIAIIGVLYKYRYKALPQASGNYGEKPYEERRLDDIVSFLIQKSDFILQIVC